MERQCGVVDYDPRSVIYSAIVVIYDIFGAATMARIVTPLQVRGGLNFRINLTIRLHSFRTKDNCLTDILYTQCVKCGRVKMSFDQKTPNQTFNGHLYDNDSAIKGL